MGEILPDGSIQGYFNQCPYCKKDMPVNMQGQGSHGCPEEIAALKKEKNNGLGH